MFDIKKVVPSLELCLKLKELGYPQNEGGFYWVKEDVEDGCIWRLKFFYESPNGNFVKAPTVGELGRNVGDEKEFEADLWAELYIQLLRDGSNKSNVKEKYNKANYSTSVSKNKIIEKEYLMPVSKNKIIKKEKRNGSCNTFIPSVPKDKILELYHKYCRELPQVRKLSGMDRKMLRARWRENPDLSFWDKFFRKVAFSDFLMGKNDKGWCANFHWLIHPSNFVKVWNGVYDNRKVKNERYSVPEKLVSKEEKNEEQQVSKPFIAISREFFENLSIERSRTLYLYCWLVCNAFKRDIKNYPYEFGNKNWKTKKRIILDVEKDECLVSKGELAKDMGCKYSVITKILDNLYSFGLIVDKKLFEHKKAILGYRMKIKRWPKQGSFKVLEEDFKKFNPKTQTRTFYVYCWLLKEQMQKREMVKYKDGDSYKRFELQPGQLIVSKYSVTKTLNMTFNEFCGYVKTLENMGLIWHKSISYYYTVIGINSSVFQNGNIPSSCVRDNGKKEKQCPYGHEFGVDTDKYEDCDNCELWDECADVFYG